MCPVHRMRNTVMAKKHIQSNEVVLCEEDGKVREGCSSNFFVVRQGTVYSAIEGVLEGTVQLLVHEACKELSVPLSHQIQEIQQVCDWDECFLSSTSRLVLPVDSMIIGEDCTSLLAVPQGCNTLKKMEATGEFYVQFSNHAISTQLLEAVRNKMIEKSALVYTSCKQ